jgi:hypothetical protein
LGGVGRDQLAVAILLHELGHYAMSLAFHFPGVALHYASADNGAADAVVQQMQAGNSAAAAALFPF